MPKILSVEILGHSYEIACDDEQEDYLLSLGNEVNQRSKELARSVGQAGDARLLVMIALSMADEINELKKKVSSKLGENIVEFDKMLAKDIDEICQRVESIAKRLNEA